MDKMSFVFVFYYIGIAGLILAGIHRLGILFLLKRKKLKTLQTKPKLPSPLPFVTIQIPVFNEKLVVRRLLHSLFQIQYPSEVLEIQILDDSTDETSEIIQKELQRRPQKVKNIFHLRRNSRQGYKAGALQEGLKKSKGEFIAIFDADFLPPPSFLLQTLPWFSDPTIGVVQTRWGYLNRFDSLLTQIQAFMLDSHFWLEQKAKSENNFFLVFNGTAGIWRKSAIELAGGWRGDSLTEDLDLSFRAQMKGWKIKFLPDIEVPSELPNQLSSVKAQQRRWAKGSSQVLRLLLPPLISFQGPLMVRLEIFFHLLRHFTYGALLIILALVPWVIEFRGKHNPWNLFDAFLLGLSTWSVAWFFLKSSSKNHLSFSKKFKALIGAFAFGIGIALNNTLSGLQGLWTKEGVFVRTPKMGDIKSNHLTSFYRPPSNPEIWFEFLFVIYLWFVSIRLLKAGYVFPLPFYVLTSIAASLPIFFEGKEKALLWMKRLKKFQIFFFSMQEKAAQKKQIQRKINHKF